MLLSFRFQNHRSFRDEQQLNLLPVYENDTGEEDLVLDAVPVVGIFGANASGKSNLIGALGYMSSMVGQSDRESEPGRGPRRQPFRLDPETAEEPSSYVVDLMLDGVHHTYGFTLDYTGIIEEWLYTYPMRRRRVIFERNREQFTWGEESRRSTIRRLEDIVAPSALFLSVSARFEPHARDANTSDPTAEILHRVFSWLWQSVIRDSRVASYAEESLIIQYSQWLTDPARQTALRELLRNADIGLADVRASRPEIDERGVHDIGQVSFLHHGAADSSVQFQISDESSGTLRLLELAAEAIPILTTGGLLLVDEIDASLHPLLTVALVRLFQSPGVNRRGAQLMFTTHDATLLGSIDGEDVVSRDGIWFTSKRDDGASELFPLSEFKPRRQGENRQRRYLNGSYGAIPELSMRMFEQAVTSRADEHAG